MLEVVEEALEFEEALVVQRLELALSSKQATAAAGGTQRRLEDQPGGRRAAPRKLVTTAHPEPFDRLG